MNATQAMSSAPVDVSEHPLVHHVQEHCESLSPVERFCKRIADRTGAPVAPRRGHREDRRPLAAQDSAS